MTRKQMLFKVDELLTTIREKFIQHVKEIFELDYVMRQFNEAGNVCAFNRFQAMGVLGVIQQSMSKATAHFSLSEFCSLIAVNVKILMNLNRDVYYKGRCGFLTPSEVEPANPDTC